MSIFSYKDEDAGYKALGLSPDDERVQQFNQTNYNKYNELKNSQIEQVFAPQQTDEEVQAKGQIDMVEVYNKHHPTELLPYYGSSKAGFDEVMIYKNLEKMKRGELLSDKEVEDTRKYIQDMRELELRGMTLPARIEEGLYSSAPYLIEAGIGFLTAEYGVGLGSLAQTTSKFALRQSARGFAKQEIRNQLKKGAKEIAKAKAKQLAVDSTVGVARFTAEKTLTEVFKRTGDFLISDDIAVSERGQYILNESKSNPAKAVLLAFGDTMIENFSETTGELFGLMGKGIGNLKPVQAVKKCIDKNILKKLPADFSEKFVTSVEGALNMPFLKALNKYGYHGIIEEMGEERAGDLLRFAFNMDGEEGYSFKQFLSAIAPDREQLVTEAILFGLTGGGVAIGLHGAKTAINKASYKSYVNDIKEACQNEDGSYDFDKMRDLISLKNPDLTEEQFEKVKTSIIDGIKKAEDYTIDDFLVDTGIMRTPYKGSITDERISEVLEKHARTPEEINQILTFANNETKAKLMLNLGDINTDEAREVQEDFKSKLIADGVSENKADFTAKLYVQLLIARADRTGRSLEELYEEENLKVIESEEERYQDMADYYENVAQETGMNQFAQIAGAEEGTTHYIVFNPEQIKSTDNRGTFDADNPNIFYQEEKNQKDDITQRTDKTKYLTDNEVEQVKKDSENFSNYVGKLIKGELSYRTQLRVLERLTSAYNKIPELKGKKVVITQDVYKKIIDLPNKFDKNHFIDRTRAIKLPQLIADPLYILKSNSEGNEHRFVIVSSSRNNKTLQRLSIILNPKSNVAVVSAYDEKINISEEKKAGRVLYNKKEELSKTILTSKARAIDNSKDSITDNAGNFNPSVKNSEEYHQDEPEQQSIFEGNNKAREFRKYKGYFIPAEDLIVYLKGADESTIVHEMAHRYLNNLINDAKYHEGSKLDLDAVRKFVRNNGEPFTREQHEKFARGFEAYVRSGWAKNNRLKKVFEDFKNFLLQIYDNITQVVYSEDGVEKPFTEEDMPQITALFDRLLSTENERIQATVFDKVNEIEEKINAIKANEQKEFDELDTIYKDNIEINNRKSDKKRAVGEYIEMAKTAASRESKELKAWKKRYKEVTYQILEVATGYPRQFIANKRNWDKVEQKIADIDDPFSGGDGFQGQWNEFYSDTGVSYETDEIGGDYKLAEQAFNVMSEGLYNKPLEDYLDFRDIDKFTGEFEYLENKIPKLKGTEKENAFEALTILTLDLAPEMPDSLYQDFLHRLVEIEVEKKEEQKEDFNKKRYPNIPVMQQLQWYVTNKLNNLKIYNPEMRYKTRLDKSHGLYKQIRNASSVNDTKRIVKRINELVIEDMRNNQRAILHKEIQKQVKINSKLVKVGSIKRGKFDWRTNTVFAELVEMNKLSMDEAQTQFNELLRLNELEAGEERIDWRENSDEMADTMKSDFQDNLKRKFLQYKSSRMKSLDVYHTSSLLSDILTLKAEGRRAKDAEDFIKKTERLDYRNNLIEILDKHKENKTAKFLANWVVGSGTLMNWETLLNTVFDNDTAKKYSLQNLESQVQVFSRNKTLELINKANEIYGFTNNTWDKLLDYDNSQKFIKLMQEYANETYDYSEVTWNKETQEAVKTGLKLSRAEIMTIYTWYFNRELARRLDNQYGYKQLQDMFSKLSEKDKAMCFEFVNICESMYDAMNEVYIDTYGISLPKVENYFPSVTERVGSDLDMLHDFVVKSSNPSFIKQRKTCNRIPMKPKSPLEIILPHINKSANYIIMSETVNFYNKIFKETPLNKKIVDVFGKDKGEKIVRAIQNQLSASTFTTVARGITFAHEFADNLATNFISSSIAGSPKVMFSQLLSVINYAENMPAHLWAKGFTKAIAHPKETFNYMMSKCPYLQARLAGNTQNEMMSTLTSEVDRFRTLKNFCSMNTKWGDILAIIFGGRPYVEYLMSEGMSEEEAFSKFVDDTLRAQQAGLNSTTSEWQKAQTKSVIGRAFFAFNNTNLQYERKFIDALSRLTKGDISTAQFAKSFIIYKILNPVLFTSVLGNLSLLMLFRSLFGGDEPDKAFATFGGDVGLAIMLGSIKAYGMAGYIATQIINYGTALVQKKIFDEKPYVFESKVPILSSVDTIFKKAMKKEIEFSDYVDIMGDIGDLATGLPATRTFNALGGVGDVARGDIGIGATRMLGFGKYKATEAWTGQSPKERKKK